MPITIDTMYGTFDETALNDIKGALEDIKRLEEELAHYVGVKHCIAMLKK